MYSGDELYDDETTSHGYPFDPLARADWIRDQLKNSSACRTCGSLDPAIIEGPFCSDCPDEGEAVRRRTREAIRG